MKARRSLFHSVAVALLALASFGLSCGQRTKPVILIGMDGLEWSLLDPLIARGELPNFARFKSEGASGRLRSEPPLLSPIIWTTIATGLPPDRHRVLDFTAPDPSTGSPVVITSLHRRVKAFWNILDEKGIGTGTIAWWASWPAEILDHGFMVSDRIGYHAFIGEDRPTRSVVYPPALTETVLGELRDPESVTYAEASPFLHVSEQEFDHAHGLDFNDPLRHFRYIYVTMQNVTRLATSLYARERPRVLAVYYEGIDTAGHTYMRFAPPDHPATTPEERARFGGTVEAFYRYQDRLLGELMGAIGEATYVIVSDHGFLTGAERPAHLERGREFVEAPRWHRRDGVIMALGPGVQRAAVIDSATIRDVTPTILALAGVPASNDMQGHVLPEIVPAAAVPARVASYEDPRWLAQRQEMLAASTFDQEIMSRLAALGYITPDGGNDDASARGWLNLGSYYNGQGNVEEAKAAFLRALEVEPENAQAHSNLGRLLAEHGELHEALPHLERALADDPEHLQVADWLVRALAAEGSLARAAEVGEAAARAHPDEVSILVNLGIVYRLSKRPGEAEQVFRSVLAKHPDNAASWFNLGEIQVQRGQRTEAIRSFREVLRVSPGDAQASARLAQLGAETRGNDAM